MHIKTIFPLSDDWLLVQKFFFLPRMISIETTANGSGSGERNQGNQDDLSNEIMHLLVAPLCGMTVQK